MFTQHGATRYTTPDILDAEQRLLETANQPTRYGLSLVQVADLVAAFEQRYHVTLDEGQRALVLGFTGDPRRLVVGIGPAGAGKTTAMKAVAEAWGTTGRRVVPLAPSAAAADVLATELGCRAENLHKFQHAHTTGNTTEDPWYVLQPGDLVLVDEAGMAGTRRLDWLVRYARERGAVVRLLGDPSQLSAVEAGGALRLLVHDVGAVELSTVHRFSDPEEAAATLALRDGRMEALEFYFTHDGVSSGTNDAMLEESYEAWAADTRKGHTSLLIASAGRDVSALNARARLDRVDTGEVCPDGVQLRDGNLAGIGDRIVTRSNCRQLETHGGKDFVKNGDLWIVEELDVAGDLIVRHMRHGGQVRLPANYVAEYVELGYATTTARAQGMTVDSAHVLVDATTSRESLYVSATRGRHGAHLYVATDDVMGLDAERPPSASASAWDLLADALQRESGERSATDVRRTLAERAGSRQRAVDECRQEMLRHRQASTVVRVLGPELGKATISDPAFPVLAQTLSALENAGSDNAEILRLAVGRGDLQAAGSLAKVLNHRVQLVTSPRVREVSVGTDGECQPVEASAPGPRVPRRGRVPSPAPTASTVPAP